MYPETLSQGINRVPKVISRHKARLRSTPASRELGNGKAQSSNVRQFTRALMTAPAPHSQSSVAKITPRKHSTGRIAASVGNKHGQLTPKASTNKGTAAIGTMQEFRRMMASLKANGSQ